MKNLHNVAAGKQQVMKAAQKRAKHSLDTKLWPSDISTVKQTTIKIKSYTRREISNKIWWMQLCNPF